MLRQPVDREPARAGTTFEDASSRMAASATYAIETNGLRR
jgi:hypothetical protein